MAGHSTIGIKASAPLRTAAVAPMAAPALCPAPEAGSYQELTNLYVHGDLFFCGVPWNPSMVPTPAKAYFIQITGTTSYATVKAMLLANSISDDVGNTYVVQNASATAQSMACLSVPNAVNWPTAADATNVKVGLNQTVVFSSIDPTAAGTYVIESVSGEVFSFSGGATGLTPSAPTYGSIVLGGTLLVANGGTGGTTPKTAMQNLLPSQAGQGGNVLSTDGSGNLSWAASASGTVTSVSYTGDAVIYDSTPTAAVTTSGTLTPTLLTQSSNTFLSGDVTNGVTAQPAFRQIDYPDLNPSFAANGSSASGYQKFPGGLIIQWGTSATATPPSANSVAFAVPFANVPQILFTPQSNQGINVSMVQLFKDRFSFTAWAVTTNTGLLKPAVVFDWMAIGF